MTGILVLAALSGICFAFKQMDLLIIQHLIPFPLYSNAGMYELLCLNLALCRKQIKLYKSFHLTWMFRNNIHLLPRDLFFSFYWEGKRGALSNVCTEEGEQRQGVKLLLSMV